MFSSFRVFETEQFLKDLDSEFSGINKKIKVKLTSYVYPQLKANPFFGKNIKKLVNYNPETWRYRIGNYRYFYNIDQKRKIVYMVLADNRKDAY